MPGKISFIGSGNVATQLAMAFDKAGLTIHQIISRHKDNAFALAKKFGSYHSDSMGDLYTDIDFLIIAVSDDAIADVAQEISLTHTLVAHTSGAVPMSVLEGTSHDYGVFYPLQSFSGAKINLLEVPVLIEASDDRALKRLDKLAFEISNTVIKADSEERRKIHLAAVMVNNFTNHLFYKAGQYMQQHRLPFNILLPLIRETVRKLEDMNAYDAQTGPARRRDRDTINRHLEMLEDNEELARFYAEMTMMIEDTYRHEEE